ncbi:hypothetical protein HDU97_007995 [Phlyctochytrium planicorne]|nr:hypothetical protein HDU97_007995 [Phlyctochytrium planicorne]
MIGQFLLVVLSILPASDAIIAKAGFWKVKGGGVGVTCIHAALLPNRKLLCIERPHTDPYPILNPNTGGWTSTETDLSQDPLNPIILKDLTSNAFCAGHAQAADGGIWVFGGDRQNSTDNGAFFLAPGIDSRRKYIPKGIYSSTFTTSNQTTGFWENERYDHLRHDHESQL